MPIIRIGGVIYGLRVDGPFQAAVIDLFIMIFVLLPGDTIFDTTNLRLPIRAPCCGPATRPHQTPNFASVSVVRQASKSF